MADQHHSLDENVTQKVSTFYDKEGWLVREGVTQDAFLNEDLRDVAAAYVSKCRRRILRYLPTHGVKLLDAASGPVQYPEYLEYSQKFSERHCCDVSEKALHLAAEKLGDHGRYLKGDLLEMDLDDDFDAVVSLHTIYHIHKDRQEEAVLKLLKSCKEGAPLVIVYSNPDYILGRLARMFKRLLGIKSKIEMKDGLYFFSHPLSWWQSFSGVAHVEFFPWRSLSSRHQKILVPDNFLGKGFLGILFWAEDVFSSFFVKHFKYTTIVLRAKKSLEARRS